VGRSLPYRAYHTIHDTEITRHYRQIYGSNWDHSYTVWIGPSDGEIPDLVKKENGE